MNAIQLRKNVNSKTVAIVVFGACENHGDHMPFGSDFFVPMELARRVASHARNVLVLPAFPYGVSSHHSDFQMTVTLEPITLIGIGGIMWRFPSAESYNLIFLTAAILSVMSIGVALLLR